MNSVDARRQQPDKSGQADAPPAGAPVRATDEARQGVTGHNVRYMLGFGLLAVIILFAAIYIYYFHS
jgi:hypothetical protein